MKIADESVLMVRGYGIHCESKKYIYTKKVFFKQKKMRAEP